MDNIKQTVMKHKKRIYLLVLFTFLFGMAIIAQAFMMTKVIDGVFLQNQSFIVLVPWLCMLLFVLLVRFASDYASKQIGVAIAAEVKRDVRKELLKKYAKIDFSLVGRGQTGRKVSMLLDGVDEMDSFYSQFIPQVMQSTFAPLLILIVIFTQHINSGLILLISAPFIPIFMIIIGIKTQKKSEEKLDKLASFSGTFLEMLRGLVTLKLFGQTKKQQQELEKSSLGFRDTTMDILKVAFTQSFALELISMLSIGIVALELAIQLIIFENISFFPAFVVLILVPEFFTSLKELGTTFHNGRTSMGAAAKVLEELEEEHPNLIDGKEQFPIMSVPPTIQLQKLTYHFPNSDFRIQEIDATILPKQKIAIVGPSGAGKTTLLHLLSGMLQPDSGHITIQGEDLLHYSQNAWLDNIAYISQNPYIFTGTIRENIALGMTQHTDKESIQKAAKSAGIASLIESLELGYETRIGEAGRGLSNGEKQRISIARAFLKQPSVVLFDEPTRGLDLATEEILQQSIEKLNETATVITVAHRLHTIKTADQILFLDKGALLGIGTHETLLETLPSYKEMVTIQQGGKKA